jgi:hypothetical protein
MSKMSKPSKVNIRKAGTTVTNIKRESDLAVDERRRKIDEVLNAQKFVDDWNNECVGKKGMDGKDLVEHFNNIQLDNGFMVIQMFMENPIKSIVKNENDEVVSLNFSLQQIDGRKRNTDQANWVTTPFPVIDKGVIMAISPSLKLWYYEQKEKLAKYDKKAAEAIIVPEVGDVVYTNHFMFKDTRYYVDKQTKCEDFVKSQEELRLNNFDFLFKVTNYEIESIVKRDRVNNVLDNKGAAITTINSNEINSELLDGE